MTERTSLSVAALRVAPSVAVPRAPFGTTGINVSQLAMGTMSFAGQGKWRPFGAVSANQAERIVRTAIDAGVNLFDTANVYSDGAAESMLARALGPLRKDVLLSTKVGCRSALSGGSSTREEILEQADASLSRLRTDVIDLYHLHRFDALTPLIETVGALSQLLTSGKVRFIACSNFTPSQLAQFLHACERESVRVTAVQCHYSLLCRDAELDLFPVSQAAELGVLAWGALGGGRLSNAEGWSRREAAGARLLPPRDHRESTLIPELARIAAALQITLPQLAIGWLRTRSAITTTLLGVTTIEQLRENLASPSTLPAYVIRTIDRMTAVHRSSSDSREEVTK